MRLGHHKNDCLGNLTLCPNGSTLSIWFKLESRITDFSHLFHSTLYSPRVRTYSSDYAIYFHLRNETHKQVLSDFPRLLYGEWHHLGITYNSGFEVYVDGCVPLGITKKMFQESLVYKNEFEFGCDGGNKCTRAHLDDLRFWNVKKSRIFMWWLSKMHE